MSARTLKPLGIAVAVFALLLVAATFGVPRLVRSSAQDWVATNLPGKALELGDARFNPLTLTLTLNELAIGNSAAEPMVAVEELILNASAASLFSLSPHFDAITITRPQIDAVLRPDASLNLAELIPPDDGEPLPQVQIKSLSLDRGAVRFTDQRGQAPLTKTLTPITFSLANFSTAESSNGGGFKLAGRSQAGEAFAFEGTLSAAPLASTGALTLTNIRLETLARFAADALPLESASGSLSLAGDYSVTTPKDPEAPLDFTAHLGQLSFADVALTTTDQASLTLAAARLGDTRYSAAQNSLTIGPLAIETLKASLASGERLTLETLALESSRLLLVSNTLETGALTLKSLNVTGGQNPPLTLAAASLAASSFNPGTAETAANISLGALTLGGLTAKPRLSRDYSPSLPGLWPQKAATASPTPALSYSIASLTMTGTDLTLIHPAARTSISGDISLGALDSSLTAQIPLTADLRIGRAPLKLSGTFTPASSSAALAIALQNLDIAALAPMAPKMPVTIKRGLFSLDGRLALRDAVPRFTGGLSLASLDIKQPLPAPPSGPDAPSDAPTTTAPAAPADLASLKRLSAQGITATPSRIDIKRLAFDTLIANTQLSPSGKLNLIALTETAETPQAPTTPTPSPTSTMATMPSVHIDTVTVANSSVGFQDFAITPNFAVRIEALEGRITNIDSRPGRVASVDLKGHVVDRFSPVTIAGTGNLFNYADAADITAKFANIELPVFNPYSGRFAGYSIARGKLETTLHYRINNRALQADHQVVIDQLTWGEATDSKDKVSLPLRLATSLLKDRNGVITLDLPVAGTVDDPTFRIWPVVWKIVGNVMTKLITAPFAALGSLFGSGSAEQAHFIAFAPGEAVVAPENAAALATLAKGLADKPVLNLDIAAGPAIREDAAAITATRLHKAVAERAKAQSYAALDEGKIYSALKKLAKDQLGDSPDFPEDMDEKPARIAWMEEQLAPKYEPSNLDLASLGQSRANAVKAALLADDALDPARIFLNTETSVALKDDTPTMELKIK
jgi:hypothetical protein